MSSEEAIAQLLARYGRGEAELAELTQPLYADLHALADACMRRERRDHTLQPTALVHEAFLRYADLEPGLVQSRAEFLALAARVMRNSLVDHARARTADKRRAPGCQVSLSGLEELDGEAPLDVLDLHAALEELEQLDPRQARIVELSAFGGLGGAEIAEQLGVHRNTVVRELRMARAWLRRSLEGGAH